MTMRYSKAADRVLIGAPGLRTGDTLSFIAGANHINSTNVVVSTDPGSNALSVKYG